MAVDHPIIGLGSTGSGELWAALLSAWEEPLSLGAALVLVLLIAVLWFFVRSVLVPPAGRGM